MPNTYPGGQHPNEVLIQDYFQNMRTAMFKRSDWQDVNRIRNQLNSCEFESDMYQLIYRRRMTAFNRAEDERLFGIPKDLRVYPERHGAQVKNRWYGYMFGDSPNDVRAGTVGLFGDDGRPINTGHGGYKKDYCKRDIHGNIKRDKYGVAKEYGRFGQAVLNAGDHAMKGAERIMKIIQFVVMHPILSLIILLTPLIVVALLTASLYIAGTINSIGHTPFVLCGEDDGGSRLVGALVQNKSIEQMATIDYAIQVYILKADEKGFTSNAIIGSTAYMIEKGSHMGTFSYEKYWEVPGPSGVTGDLTLDNNAWRNWILWAREYLHTLHYHNPARTGHYCFEASGLRYSEVGLGFLCGKDKWNYDIVTMYDEEGNPYLVEVPYQIEDTATQLLDYADAHGAYWQDPETQIDWLLLYLEKEEPWNGDGCNPFEDDRTAEEWCRRLVCGMDHWDEGWEHNDTNEEHNAEIDLSTRHLEEAQELYKKYSGKDINLAGLSGNLRNECEGYRTNFSIGNASIAEAAVALGSTSYHAFDQWGSNAPALNNSDLALYKQIHMELLGEDKYFASCDRAVCCAVRWSGADLDYPPGGVTTQYNYLIGRGKTKWTFVGRFGEITMQPGDVMIRASDTGHTKIWVGNEIIQKYYPGSNADTYQASYGDYYPYLSKCGPGAEGGAVYWVFRCTNPDTPQSTGTPTTETVETTST